MTVWKFQAFYFIIVRDWIIMQVIQQEKQLPRFFKQFIGKGHELEEKKKKRRKVELEERSLANRVLFLEKEQIRAQKSLINKRQELSRIMGIAQRQAHEKQQRERALLERQRKIEQIKQENHLRRIFHKQNQERSLNVILQRNSLDYKISKKKLEQYEKRKQLEKDEDLTARKERYVSLNATREQGRSRIDKFFKSKNKQHTKLYLQKIKSEEEKTKQKLNTIKKLGDFQELMRKRLQQSSLRVSQMDQILGNVSKEVRKRTVSRSSLDRSSLYNSPTLITSIEGELLSQRDNTSGIKLAEGKQGLSEGTKVRKRRNSQFSRYYQYDIV